MEINYIAVLVAAVAYFVVGFLFHGPFFGKVWMKLANITPTGNEKFSDMYGQMFWNLVSNIVTAYVIAYVFWFSITSQLYLSDVATSSSGPWNGMVCAFWLWLGFIVTGSSMEVIWMGRSVKLWLFEITSTLVGFLVMGAIIGAW